MITPDEPTCPPPTLVWAEAKDAEHTNAAATSALKRTQDVMKGSLVSKWPGSNGIHCATFPEARHGDASGKTQSLLSIGDPAPDRGVATEMESALMGDAGVGQQRNVREAEAIADKVALL